MSVDDYPEKFKLMLLFDKVPGPLQPAHLFGFTEAEIKEAGIDRGKERRNV